ncbi:ABC transporter substrate-binding protein [Mycolicibacterium palauense]|uniref:ABC transporter substrate-binding protein n=1 Tax=Mycolicibacterium palauense TaxID=2034511 RepID=UPI001C3F27D8|nr:ABC transporter substrate-binding protein [Mycolicibacterium palauense]
MHAHLSRRGFLGAAGATALLLTAACGSDEPAPGNPGGGAVTIKHLFGETTIPEPPTRVVSAGLTEQDDLLALGAVPLATTEWFGNQPYAVWPWARAALGDARPEVLSLADGIQIDRIAALRPDLIVAVNAGVDAETYRKLSAIAPTVPQSGADAFFEPWQEQARTIGMATFHAERMAGLIDGVNQRFTAAGTANEQFKDKKAILLQGTLPDGNAVATAPGWRTDFLTEMGFTIPDALNAYTQGSRAVIPPQEIGTVLDVADVLIWTTESEADQAALLADPNVAELRATARDRNVFTTKDLAGAIAFASVLSYPVVADRLPPLLARALS